MEIGRNCVKIAMATQAPPNPDRNPAQCILQYLLHAPEFPQYQVPDPRGRYVGQPGRIPFHLQFLSKPASVLCRVYKMRFRFALF